MQNSKNKLITIPPRKVKLKKPLTRRQAKMLQKNSKPFLLLDNDPANFGKPFEGERRLPIVQPIKFNRLNLIKSLTILKTSAIIKRVKKLKRKDDKMAQTKKQKSNKSNAVKSVAWLVFAAQQAFIGCVLLSNFSNYFVIVSALLSLGIAGIIVVAHFFKAHK